MSLFFPHMPFEYVLFFFWCKSFRVLHREFFVSFAFFLSVLCGIIFRVFSVSSLCPLRFFSAFFAVKVSAIPFTKTASIPPLKRKTNIHVRHNGQLIHAFKSKTIYLKNILTVIYIRCAGIDFKSCFFVPIVFVFQTNIKTMIIRQTTPV